MFGYDRKKQQNRNICAKQTIWRRKSFWCVAFTIPVYQRALATISLTRQRHALRAAAPLRLAARCCSFFCRTRKALSLYNLTSFGLCISLHMPLIHLSVDELVVTLRCADHQRSKLVLQPRRSGILKCVMRNGGRTFFFFFLNSLFVGSS
jgi:hypothetical protein